MVRRAIVLLGSLFFLSVMRGQQPADGLPKQTVEVQADAPLPAIPELMRDVESNEDVVQKMQRDYTYHVHTETQNLDGKGGVKKTETTDAESLSIDGVLVNRIVARDGKPLTPDEAKKEDAKIDKEVAKDKERKAKLESEGKPSDSNGGEELTLSRILQLGTFSNERRVTLNDRSTIMVDYAGDPNAKTKTRFEAVFRDLVGTVWIDEKDHTLVQVQGHFLNDFKIGGGLVADVKKDSHFSGKFTKVNDEAWLPVEFEGEGRVRILLFVGFNGRFRATASDYRKFRTSTTIISTNRVIGDDGKPVVDQPVGVTPKP